MAIQTQQLSESLPHFARHFRSADAKGSSDWQIVLWQDIDPSEVTPEEVKRPDKLTDAIETIPNRFDNRTQALRFSKAHARRQNTRAVETGHWGVWRWIQNGSTYYQSVLPIAANPSTKTGGVVKESASEPYSSMVRVSPDTNRRLREIGAAKKATLQSVIDAAVKEYHAAWFFRNADKAYEALRGNNNDWSEELEERMVSEATLLDGLDADEWDESGAVDLNDTKAGHRG